MPEKNSLEYVYISHTEYMQLLREHICLEMLARLYKGDRYVDVGSILAIAFNEKEEAKADA